MITELNKISELISKFKIGELTDSDAKLLKNTLLDIIKSGKFIGWIFFIENDIQQVVRIHNNYENPEQIIDFKFNDENKAETIIFDLITGKYEINKDYFLFIYIIPFEKPLSLPNIQLKDRPDILNDYTVRDYYTSWRSIINLISLSSPELALLISDRNSPDFLFLDALCFLYDRLQFYIDFATTIRDPEKATGQYLDLIARFWGLSKVPIPQPSKLYIPIVFRKDFIMSIINYFTKFSPSIKNAIVLKFNNLNLSDSNILNEIKTTKGKAILNLNLSDYIINLEKYPVENPTLNLEYKFLENRSVLKYLNLDIERTIKIDDRYIEPESIKIDKIYKSGQEITKFEVYYLYDLSDYNKILLRAKQLKDEIELGKLSKDLFFIPIFIRVNRYGEAEITFLDSPLEDINLKGEISVNIKYSVSTGAEMNDAEYDDRENIKVLKYTDQIFENVEIEFFDGTNLYKEKLSDIISKIKWTKSEIALLLYVKLDDLAKDDIKTFISSSIGSFDISSYNFKSYGGTNPLTDEELRNLLKIPLRKEFFVYSPLEFLKRAANELDYELILKLNESVPVLDVKVYYNKVFKEEIEELTKIIIKDPDYKYIPILPFTVDIFILGKQKEYKTLKLSNNRQETIELIKPYKLSILEIDKLRTYLNKFRFPTHYIRLFSNINIMTKYLKGIIYTSDIDQVKKALIEAQNLLCLRTKIGETITPQKINSILLEKLPTSILEIDYKTYDAGPTDFIYVDFSRIIIKDIILYEPKTEEIPKRTISEKGE